MEHQQPAEAATVPTVGRMAQPTVPASHRALLEEPNYAHLATVRPDGSPQSSVMWFGWDGERARFTHTTTRQKFRNFTHEPRVSFSVIDPANPYRFIEVRGVVESIEPDPDGTFYRSLMVRYGIDAPITDAAVRVVVTVVPTSYVTVEGGRTERERDS
jgi:PPOX class probable F420-dependent enzyme